MRPTKFHKMKEYDSTKNDWKGAMISLLIFIVLVILIILI